MAGDASSGTSPLTGTIGVDIGGTGVKAAVVRTDDGTLLTERLREPTPNPATPEAVADLVAALVDDLDCPGPVGLTVPAVVHGGVVRTAANIDDSWIDLDAEALFTARTGRGCAVLNDADAAGMAEMRFGAGAGRLGVVIMVTLGTGIGSAVFSDGVLVPNTELGHLEMEGGDAEDYAAESVREAEDLSWSKWGHRVGRYLNTLERLFSPDLVIIGGGVSKKFDRYVDEVRSKLHPGAEVVPAEFRNQAGIVGAAMAVHSRHVRPHAPMGTTPITSTPMREEIDGTQEMS